MAGVSLEDVQARPDSRGIVIDEVGVSGLRYPVSVPDRDRGKQDTVAVIGMSVGLPAEVKGAHLSRFLEVFAGHTGELTVGSIAVLLGMLQHRLGSATARLTADFPYFRPRAAPVTGAAALMDYTCTLAAAAVNDDIQLSLRVQVPVTSVCPCSKAISDYGAHNQRSSITIEAWPVRDGDGEFTRIWIDDLIEVAEACASSPLYPLLKRPDERHVTMAAHDHPAFVEDMVRQAAALLSDDPRITAYSVEAASDESIHNHGAFARLERRPQQ